MADFLRRGWVAEVLLAVAAAALGAVARGLVQAYCTSAHSGPEGGTPGGNYCAKVSPTFSWPVFVAVAVAGALVISQACRRLRYRRGIALAIVFAVMLANTVVVNSLPAVGP